jgi:hypothetical protein
MRSLATYLVCLSVPLALTLSGCGGTPGATSATSLSPSDQRGQVPLALPTTLPIVINNNYSAAVVNVPPGLQGNCWSVAKGSIPHQVDAHTQSSSFTLEWPTGSASCSTSATIGYSPGPYIQELCYLVVSYNTAEERYSYAVQQGAYTDCSVVPNVTGNEVFTYAPAGTDSGRPTRR